MPFEVPFNPTYGLNLALFKTEILLVGAATAVGVALVLHAAAHITLPHVVTALTEAVRMEQQTLAAWQTVSQLPAGRVRQIIQIMEPIQ